MLYDEKIIRFHIKPNKNLTLKEYTDCLLLIDKSINYINRYYGVNNRFIHDYATEVVSIQNGSIIMDMKVKFSKRKDEIIKSSKVIAKEVVKKATIDFGAALLVGILLNGGNNKTIYNHQENRIINIYKIAVDIEIGKEYARKDGNYIIKLVDESTIEIGIDN